MPPVNSSRPATDRKEKKSSNRSGTFACSRTVELKSNDRKESERTRRVKAKNRIKRNAERHRNKRRFLFLTLDISEACELTLFGCLILEILPITHDTRHSILFSNIVFNKLCAVVRVGAVFLEIFPMP